SRTGRFDKSPKRSGLSRAGSARCQMSGSGKLLALVHTCDRFWPDLGNSEVIHSRLNGALETRAQAYRSLAERSGGRRPKEQEDLLQSTMPRRAETRRFPTAVLRHANQ